MTDIFLDWLLDEERPLTPEEEARSYSWWPYMSYQRGHKGLRLDGFQLLNSRTVRLLEDRLGALTYLSGPNAGRLRLCIAVVAHLLDMDARFGSTAADFETNRGISVTLAEDEIWTSLEAIAAAVWKTMTRTPAPKKEESQEFERFYQRIARRRKHKSQRGAVQSLEDAGLITTRKIEEGGQHHRYLGTVIKLAPELRACATGAEDLDPLVVSQTSLTPTERDEFLAASLVSVRTLLARESAEELAGGCTIWDRGARYNKQTRCTVVESVKVTSRAVYRIDRLAEILDREGISFTRARLELFIDTSHLLFLDGELHGRIIRRFLRNLTQNEAGLLKSLNFTLSEMRLGLPPSMALVEMMQKAAEEARIRNRRIIERIVAGELTEEKHAVTLALHRFTHPDRVLMNPLTGEPDEPLSAWDGRLSDRYDGVCFYLADWMDAYGVDYDVDAVVRRGFELAFQAKRERVRNASRFDPKARKAFDEWLRPYQEEYTFWGKEQYRHVYLNPRRARVITRSANRAL
ncbi:MAG: hypothetical protein ACOCSK_02810 [Rhodothermales bacterium]